MKTRRRAVLFLLLASGAAVVEAQGFLRQRRVTLYEENDTRYISGVARRDRHYTQGLKLQMMYGEDEFPVIADRLSGPLQKWLGACGTQRTTVLCSSGWTLGQNMYTPQDISIAELQENNRPYAAWLYGGAVLEMRTPGQVNHSFEVDIGMMGPGAFGRPIQTKWHDAINVDRPRGWSHQLRNEPGIVIHYNRRRRHRIKGAVSSWSTDLIERRNLTFGNVFSWIAYHPTMRAGYNMSQEFLPTIPAVPLTAPPAPVAPVAAAVPPQRRDVSRFEAYVFAGIEARAVAWNEMLEGNCCVRVPSHGVSPNHVIGAFEWGGVVRVQRFRLTWRQVHRSPEFEGQANPDIFGAFTLTYDGNF